MVQKLLFIAACKIYTIGNTSNIYPLIIFIKVLANNETTNGQVLVSNTNINKQIENINKTKLPKNEFEVIDFFKKKKWPDNEAKKFYNHYQGIGWKIGGKIKIEDWQATASNWMLKASEIETADAVPQKKDNLRTSKNKDYGQPL